MDNTGVITNTQVGPGTQTGGQTGTNTPVQVTVPAIPSPSNVGLPKGPVSPTAPTGVATSGLANDTLNTQAQGTTQLQGAVDNHTQNKAGGAVLGYRPDVSIVDLLSSKGMPSDFASRAKMAQQYGIQNYVGTADQNAQMIGLVNGGGQQGTTGASTGSTTTNTGTSGTTGTQTTTSTTGSPGDVYTPQLTQVQNDIGQALTDYQKTFNQIITGTFPLTPQQQSVLTNTQKQFDTISQMQMLANKSYEAAVAHEGLKLGLNLQNPQELFANQTQAIQDGLTRITDLDATAAKTMADLQQSFMDKDYQMINDNYTKLQDTLKEKASEITAQQTRMDSLYTSTRDYNEKVKEFNADQQLKKSEFSQTQQLELNKLSLQYPGLETTGSNIGQLKPGTDVNTLPGVVPVQTGINLGTSGVMFGSELPSGTESTYQMIAKRNGLGFVPKGEETQYNAVQSSLVGLNNALNSGQIDPNATVSSTIGQKNPPSIITRLFQGTQPGNISTALGESKVNIPNDNNLKWKDVPAYLQNQMQSIAGVVPGEQQAKSILDNTINTVNNGVSPSILANPTTNSNLSKSGL